MDLVDRYLSTLRFFLPKAQSEDIVRELSEEIRSQAQDKETELGRPLNQDEQASILSRYGHPLLTASRYRPQRYLVGPIVFPYYWLVIKVLLAVVAAGHVIPLLVRFTQGVPVAQLAPGIEGLIESLFAVTAVVTVIAAACDHWLQRDRALERWDPRDLAVPSRHAGRAVTHALHAAGVAGRHASIATRVKRRFGEETSVSGFVIAVALSAYLLLALKFPHLLFGSASANLSWGPSMDRLFPVLVAMRVTVLASQFMWLVRPSGGYGLRIARAARVIAHALFVYFVLTADRTQWLMWAGPIDQGVEPNAIVATVLTWVALFSVMDIFLQIARGFGTSGPRNPHVSTVTLALILGVHQLPSLPGSACMNSWTFRMSAFSEMNSNAEGSTPCVEPARDAPTAACNVGSRSIRPSSAAHDGVSRVAMTSSAPRASQGDPARTCFISVTRSVSSPARRSSSAFGRDATTLISSSAAYMQTSSWRIVHPT